jgi:O-antigen/teichoic acid export membrane protein
LISTIAIIIGLLLFAQPLCAFLYYPAHPEYIWWLAGIVGFDALSSVPFARLRLENKAKQFAAIKITNVVINTLLVIFFLRICPTLHRQGNAFAQLIYSPENRISYVFIANLAASFATLLLLSPAILRISWRRDATLWQRMMRYSLPLLLVSFAGMINEVLDRTLLKIYLPGSLDFRLHEIGIYGAAYKIPTLMMIFTTAFNYAAEPIFFSNADKSDAKELYARTAHIFSIVASVGFLGILLYVDVLQYLLGKDFREGLQIVPILLLANVCFGMYNCFSIWYKLSDRTIIGTYIAFGGAAITLIINILGIPYFGYWASAWATLACYAFICVATYVVGQRYYCVPYPLQRIVTYILSAVALFFLSQALKMVLPSSSIFYSLAANTLIFCSFLGFIFLKERK